ncbi:hypothetical protein GEOBRER4_n2929 [Citrifermentans bremense]|uniref:Uncharacterized protein n=1 Tax=Citrifermentans bremense TaxID=60035 RepID=A0A6S6M973_9BACT|nr:hypothetical protein [Citrifermentans bremense]BCG48061.1 hypothetical protein GEOBRER4_n2929 [Citrifermentans bremense]
MRKRTVRSGIRAISAAIISLMVATFFHGSLAEFFLLGLDGEARLVFFGFFLAGVLGGFGVLVAAIGLLQSETPHPKARLSSSILLLFSLIFLFLVLTYTSFTNPPPSRLAPGESINI